MIQEAKRKKLEAFDAAGFEINDDEDDGEFFINFKDW